MKIRQKHNELTERLGQEPDDAVTLRHLASVHLQHRKLPERRVCSAQRSHSLLILAKQPIQNHLNPRSTLVRTMSSLKTVVPAEFKSVFSS